MTGLVSQRNPLTTPLSFMGLNVIQRQDALIGGSNCELSNSFTLLRRPGMPRYCNQQFASNEFPLSFKSFRLNGQVVDVVDTNVAVYTFTATSKTLLFTKSAGAGQTFFQQRGNIVYMSNGVDNKKWCPNALSWAANTAFTLGQLITDSNGNVQQVTTPGTSGGSQPAWSSSPRATTADGGTLVWTMRGTPVQNWGIVAPTAAPTVAPPTNLMTCRFWSPLFTTTGLEFILLDSNGNLQYTLTSGETGTTYPVWNTTQYAVGDAPAAVGTIDGSPGSNVVWANVGVTVTWKASTAFTLNQVIIDSNGNFQRVTVPGSSGASQPSWNTTLGATTTDSGITWINDGTSQQLVFQGYTYAFAFHTIYGHVSTASPVTVNMGPALGTTYTAKLGGNGSADPQCDFIWIFRTSDGGFNYQFLGQVPNPGAGAWTLTDTTLDGALNNQILAPLNHSNDPPPTGLTYTTFYMRRMWGAVGTTMQFGIGNDLLTGVNEECWPPANLETYPAPVEALAGTSQGLVVMTYNQWWVEMGGPQTLSFYPQLILDQFGISSPNCLATRGDQLFVYTTQRLFISLTLTSGEDEIGFNVGDVLTADFNPATSYIAVHQNGEDQGLIFGDGTANLIRYSLKFNSWSTLYPIAGGVGAIGSIETGVGTYTLMAGRPTGAGFIMARDSTGTQFFDDTNTNVYTWNAQIGSLILSEPANETEEVAAIVVQQTNAGSLLSVGVRANEIAGNFVNLPFTCNDPAALSDTSFKPKTMRASRYDWDGNTVGQPNALRHLQVQISGVAENAGNEVLGLHLCPQAEG